MRFSKRIVAGLLAVASFSAAATVVSVVPEIVVTTDIASSSEMVASRYHLRSRTNNFYQRASGNSGQRSTVQRTSSGKSQSGGLLFFRFSR
ncbi:MAG: hypothetical protein JNL58_25055 [Planctomyces sp.]|nr:hypothetical protein [Planctomyces sp.]